MNCLPPSKDDEEIEDEGVLRDEDEARAVEAIGDELIPHVGLEDDEIETLNVPYSTRGPDDWVSSGTLDPGYALKAAKRSWRRKRFFMTWDEAERWARGFFGDRFKGRIQDAVDSGAPIWAFLIKGPRGVDVSN